MGKRGLIFAGLLTLATAASAQERQPPYWASIASGEAMMRSGPGKNYPGVWLYKRRDLPVKVVQLYPNWRKIVDADGAEGWMLVTLLSARRTAMVKAGAPRDVRVKADASAKVRYRAEPGVVGRIDHCDGNFCHISFGAREGFIAQGDLFGLDANERVDD